VNGRKIFCHGTNHVPLDALHSRDPQHVPALFEMLVDLYCNMVRSWGGNVYEDNAFFDECDRHGIMVWQDFAMACAVYPQTDEFAARIRCEGESVVLKLRNHPSIVLWAGNNEIDQCYGWSRLGVDPNTDIHSRKVLPEVVRRLDPYRPYLASSPYLSPEYVRRGSQSRFAPEDHLWGPRDDFKGPYYSSSRAHFVSEIGYHGCPAIETMRELLPAESLWPSKDNDAWLTHCVRPQPELQSYNYRIPLMAKQIAVLFAEEPQNIEDFIFASQASQAEAVKTFMERWRMGKWRRTGMLWWNLRDGWPLISDAVVDYFGRRKLAYGYLKASQADVCVCISEPETGVHRLMAVNDLISAMETRVTVTDLDSGETLFDRDVQIRPDCSMSIGRLPAASQPAMWHIRWQGPSGEGQNWYLAGPRPFSIESYRGWVSALRQRGALP
jgi:beta-mannosidase